MENKTKIIWGSMLLLAVSIFAFNFVLADNAQEVALTSDEPTAKLTFDGVSYTIELISASDTSATVKVTKGEESEAKEISVNEQKDIKGLSIKVINAYETNLELGATLIVTAPGVITSSDAKASDAVKNPSYFILTSDAPKKSVSVSGESYSIELISASDTSATVKVSQTKEIIEKIVKVSEKIGGLSIKLINAEETNSLLMANISIEGNKLYLTSDNPKKELNLLVSNNPEDELDLNKESYSVELISTSDSSATIKVSQTKEIAEGSSKKIGGLEVKVEEAYENNFRLTAGIFVEKAEDEDDEREDDGEVSEIVIGKGEAEYGGYLLREDIRIEGDILKIKIGGLGGCWAGDFNLIWDGSYLKSIPPQVNLHLNLNEYNDICEGLISKDLKFNLKKLRVEGEKSIKINFFLSSRDTEPKYVLLYNYGEKPSDDTGVCPIDLKTCPDGSSVGRELPDCKFPKCPNECENVGLRDSGKYCSINKVYVAQKAAGEKCENNFECGSNVCVSGECVSEGLLKKILSWFKRLFGFG